MQGNPSIGTEVLALAKVTVTSMLPHLQGILKASSFWTFQQYSTLLHSPETLSSLDFPDAHILGFFLSFLGYFFISFVSLYKYLFSKFYINSRFLTTPCMVDYRSNGPPMTHTCQDPCPYAISSHMDAGLGHVTCLGQWDISKHDISRSLIRL